jgi:hypothetical protein
MYYPDLARYNQNDSYDTPKSAVYVGWLDAQHYYRTGDVPAHFLAKLWEYCSNPLLLTFGYHDCAFCQEEGELGIEVQYNNRSITFGSGEIRVIGHHRVTYIAPDMIFHYVATHNYLPPSEFIEAVLDSPYPPESDVYRKRYRLG